MSKWVVDIHGDIEGDYEIIEEYKEIMTEDDVLKAIRDICRKRTICRGCKYLDDAAFRCKFVGLPSEWEVGYGIR